MKYNTRSFTNITDEVFVGKYNGVDFTVQPGETRYFPSEVSEHIYQQLVLKIDKLHENMTSTPYHEGILGEEIMTKEVKKSLPFKEEVEDHERDFKVMQEKQKKEDLIKKEKALNIAKKND